MRCAVPGGQHSRQAPTHGPDLSRQQSNIHTGVGQLQFLQLNSRQPNQVSLQPDRPAQERLWNAREQAEPVPWQLKGPTEC